MIVASIARRRAAAARRRGDAARDRGDGETAAAHYRRYLAARADDGAIWVQLGHALTGIGRYDEADAAYRTGHRLRPGDGDVLLTWAHSRKEAGDLAAARDLYASSLAADGNPAAAEHLERLREPEAEPEPAPRPEPPAPPPEPARSRRPASRAWVEELKPFPASLVGREAALFVTHAPAGALKPHVAPYLEALEAAGVAVLLVAVVDTPVSVPPALLARISGAIVRENAGYDFAAWAHALALNPQCYGADTLYLLNDSVALSADPARLHAVLARVRASTAELVGLTETQEYAWHIQSYFLAFKPRLLSSFRLQRFFRDVDVLDDKDAVIRAYEVPLAIEVERAGFATDVLFPGRAPINPTLFAWRALLRDGFPFVKLLLLRGVFPEHDLAGWRETLADAGFDLPLLDETIAAAAITVPRAHSHDLSAHPLRRFGGTERPLRVAFFGPWNYDNGLGHASRGIVAAIRRTGCLLNLHPVKRAFHVHRPLMPPVDVNEFTGRADIAVVHLNPDSWFLLDDEQRERISHAHTRIGYWVYEADRLPDAWRRDFSSVDRIWAPARACAALFAAQDEAPVDVIPHPIEAPAVPPGDPDAMRAEFGVAGRHVLLYAFDGSSYLVRKNPAALVRAFAASGLAKRGWTLILKTKHLHDRREEGEALARLAAATPDVVVIDRTLSPAALGRLWAVCDVYASPHASEGFGLTIAEAMAAGKPVVATDWGGSTDFLDEASGYPVPAVRHVLTEDHDAYRAGSAWGQVDEAALADALRRAAAAVEAGDGRIAAAGRARVAAQLSVDAVAALVATSFAETMMRHGRPEPVFRHPPRLGGGRDVAAGDLGHGVTLVPLAPDGSVRDTGLGAPAAADRLIAFAPEGARIAPDFARAFAEAAAERADAALFYADDVAVETEFAIDRLRLKPAFDETLLAAQDHVGAPVAVRADVLAALGGLDPARGTAAVADLLFRAHAAGHAIVRVADVLLGHPGRRVRAKDADYRAMLEAQPALAAFEVAAGRAPASFALRRRFGVPGDMAPVTLLVPTRRAAVADGSGTHVERLLSGIAAVDWPMDRLRVIVGDDLAEPAPWAEPGAWPFALTRIATPRPDTERFNYAAKMNRLWRAAETEQIVFMNDDLRPTGPGWLRALQTFALDPGVGGVGARLLFEDGRLQHAGLAPHDDNAAHAWVWRRRHEGTYQDWALVQREWSMVTGALFATRRTLMERLGGFDERFALEFNDSDLCLRLRLAGYRIVCTPDAEMIHTEKASRGQAPPAGEQVALFLSRWRGWLDDDPAWHPRLRRDRVDLTPEADPDAWYA